MSVSPWYIPLTSAQTQGQGQTTAKNKPPIQAIDARLAILAIGPKPPRKFASGDKDQAHAASTLLPPHPNEIPPKKLYHPLSKNNKPRPPINVSFNNPPTFTTVPALIIHQLQRDTTKKIYPYVNLTPLQPGSVNLILLQPSSIAPKRWQTTPKIHKLVLTGPNIIKKQLSFINLSRRSIKTQFHQTEKLLQPDTKQSYSKIPDQSLHRLSAHYGKENNLIINTAIQLQQDNPSNHNLYIFYDANPNTNSGRTIGLMRVSIDTKAEQIKLLEDNQPVTAP